MGTDVERSGLFDYANLMEKIAPDIFEDIKRAYEGGQRLFRFTGPYPIDYCAVQVRVLLNRDPVDYSKASILTNGDNLNAVEVKIEDYVNVIRNQ